MPNDSGAKPVIHSFTFPSARPWSSVSPAPPQSCSTLAPPRPLVTASPWPLALRCRSVSASPRFAWVSSSPCSTVGGQIFDSTLTPLTIESHCGPSSWLFSGSSATSSLHHLCRGVSICGSFHLLSVSDSSSLL